MISGREKEIERLSYYDIYSLGELQALIVRNVLSLFLLS